MKWLQFLKPSKQSEAETPMKSPEEAQKEKDEKVELTERLHDQARRLHILEWQADVESRKKTQSKGNN